MGLLTDNQCALAIADLLVEGHCFVDTDDHAQQVYTMTRKLGIGAKATKTPTVGWLIELTPDYARTVVQQPEATVAAG